MASYLQAGWFVADTSRELRPEVLDGAVDAAGTLYRAAVPPAVIWRLAMKIRTLARVADPEMQGGMRFGEAERQIIGASLDRYAQPYAPLTSFLLDWLDHVREPEHLNALFLHLVHIHRMVQLLSHAALLREGLSATKTSKPRPKKARPRRAKRRSRRRRS